MKAVEEERQPKSGELDFESRAAGLHRLSQALLGGSDNASGEKRVLVIEDEEQILRTVEEVLEERGYSVATAADGKSAQQRIDDGPYHVVLLDLVLPGAMGLDLLKQVKERDPAATVIIITGHANYENAVAAIRGGAADFLAKPFTLDELEIAIEAALERRKLAVRALAAEAEKEAANLHFFLTMQTLIETLEARDPYTRQHSQRVAVHSVMVGRELGLSESEVDNLYVGACLHDIGKVGTRDDILLKPGRLTEQEYKVIQQHPVVGRRILGPSRFPPAVGEMVLHHHERLDGSGYPDHVAGDALPLPARICAVADVFEAMTSQRHYRPAYDREVVISQLREDSPRLYDPEVVEALVSALEKSSSPDLLTATQRSKRDYNNRGGGGKEG